ncbi:MAG TPA: hypothetical protein VMF06_05145 [Candidatus Limnocylindria bacterium]|nr:hypothetical protein [Candidatus Limnocylindria bacterium]
MKSILVLAAVVATGLFAGGCQSKQLVFTTYTKVGLNISATGNLPNSLTFGYKRFEGAIVPVDPSKASNGVPEMPSVYAVMGVTNQWFKGISIYQRFATGVAAENIAK